MNKIEGGNGVGDSTTFSPNVIFSCPTTNFLYSEINISSGENAVRDELGRFKKCYTWSRKFIKCVKCGTTEIHHSRFGYCRKCATQLPIVKEQMKRHRQSEKGKARRAQEEKRYAHTEKGILTRKKARQKYIKTEKGKAKYRRYRQTEKGRLVSLAYSEKRHAKIKELGALKKTDFEFIIQRDKSTCQFCERKLESKDVVFDHKTPLKKGGAHSIDNLQVTCQSCNSRKHTLDCEEFKKRLAVQKGNVAAMWEDVLFARIPIVCPHARKKAEGGREK